MAHNTTADLREKQIETLIHLAREGANIIYVVSDSVSTSKVKPFMEAFPDRVVNVGIAEQNCMGIAAGLANAGWIPFTGNAAPFLVSRSAEQIKVDIAYSRSNVKMGGMHAGFSYGADGITHHEVNDVSVMRGFPAVEIYVPCDGRDSAAITEYAAAHTGPVYVSFNTGKFPDITPEDYHFVPGRPLQFAEGKDITLIGLGTAVHDILGAAALLKNICSADIFSVHSARPFDGAALIDSIKKTGLVLTVEQHSTHGGAGSLIAELIADNGLGAKLHRLGVPEGGYTKNAAQEYNKRFFGLDAEGIAEKIQEMLGISEMLDIP